MDTPSTSIGAGPGTQVPSEQKTGGVAAAAGPALATARPRMTPGTAAMASQRRADRERAATNDIGESLLCGWVPGGRDPFMASAHRRHRAGVPGGTGCWGASELPAGIEEQLSGAAAPLRRSMSHA